MEEVQSYPFLCPEGFDRCRSSGPPGGGSGMGN
jgi:hypothetical protein